MSEDKLKRILATYPPVKEKPGYVWINDSTIVELKLLKEQYEKAFNEGAHEIEENN